MQAAHQGRDGAALLPTYLPDVAETLNNLGVLHSDLNQIEEARRDYEESLRIYQQFAARGSTTIWTNVDKVHRLLEELKK